MVIGQVDVVHRGHHGGIQAGQMGKDLQGMAYIQAGTGFIQENHRRLLVQHPGQHHPPLLAAGQLSVTAMAIPQHVHPLQVGAAQRPVLLAVALRPQVSETPHQGHLLHGQGEGDLGELGQQGEGFSPLIEGDRRQFAAVIGDAAHPGLG